MADLDTPQTRWTAMPPEYDNRQGWWLHDDQRWDDRFVAQGLEQDEAEYAAMLLNAGYLDDTDYDLSDFEDLILEAVARQDCSRCGKSIFAPQADTSGRCMDCQS